MSVVIEHSGMTLSEAPPSWQCSSEDVPENGVTVLVFSVGECRYGLFLSDVREVMPAMTITPLPKAPAIVEGIINNRGVIIPVLDIRLRFRLSPKALEPSDHLIIAWAGRRLVALRVDRAIDLLQVDRNAMVAAQGVVPGVEYVTWVARLPTNLVLIHDLRTFLSQTESELLGEAISTQRFEETP